MVIAALAIDGGPEASAGEAASTGAAGAALVAGHELVHALGVGFGLDQHWGFAPASGGAVAGLLVGPIVDVIAPLANPVGFVAVVVKILHVPAGGGVGFAIAGGKALVAGIFFVDGFLQSGEEISVLGFVQGGFP